jgi:methanogenic corrinoid protein MtbC1
MPPLLLVRITCAREPAAPPPIRAILPAMRTGFVELREQYLAAQLVGDQRAALRVLDAGLAGGLAVQDLQQQVVQAAQLEIGRLWQENRLSIAHEHMATAISHVALVHLFEHAAPAPARGHKVVVACVQGERHDLPARLVADYLELAGFDVRYLGADVPSESIHSVLAVERPDLLALSVTMVFNLAGLRGAVAAIRPRFPALPILVGGNALAWQPGLAAELGVLTADPDPTKIVAAVQAALEGNR